MKKFLSILVIGLLLISSTGQEAKAQGDFSPALGIAFKASTNGLGGDIVYNFHKRMSIRLGYEKLGYNTTVNFEEQDISYDAVIDFATGSTSLLYDLYLARGIFVTAGAGLNLFHVDVDGSAASAMPFGDIEISPEMIGDFDIMVDPSNKISPYVGIGFGRTLGLRKKLSAAFEIGGFYQGPIDLTIDATGLLTPTSNPAHKQAEKLEHQFDQYKWWPVLKLSISYRIMNFK